VGERCAQGAGFEWQVGAQVAHGVVGRVAVHMARAGLSLAQAERPAPELEQLWLTPPLGGPKNYDAVIFSGGVGEYVYGNETHSFGDLGAPLGKAVANYIHNGELAWPIAPARECIRATVIGAAQ